MVLCRKGRRHLDLQLDLIHQTCCRVGMVALNDANALGGQVALLAETQYKDSRTGADESVPNPRLVGRSERCDRGSGRLPFARRGSL